MGIELILSCLLTAASAGVWTGLIVYYFASNNKNENQKEKEQEAVVKASDIYEYVGVDKIVIKADGTEYVLSITGEERLRNLLNEKNKQEVVITAKGIYQYVGMDKILINAGGTVAVLSISGEERLLNLLNEKKKSSLMYSWNKQQIVEAKNIWVI